MPPSTRDSAWFPATPLHPDGAVIVEGPAACDGHSYIRFWCGANGGCGSTYEVGLAAIAAKFGYGMRRNVLLRRLRCRCGNRRISLQHVVDAVSVEHRRQRGPLPVVSAPWPAEIEDVWEDYMCTNYAVVTNQAAIRALAKP